LCVIIFDLYLPQQNITIMKTFKIEFHFRYNVDEKDFDIETIEANSYSEAVEILKDKYSTISIFKTEMRNQVINNN